MTRCFSHCSLRDELQDLRVDLVLLEIDRRDAVLLRQEVRDLLVADEPEPRERVAEVLARAILLVLSLPELRERDQLLPDEQLAEPVRVRHVRQSVGDDGEIRQWRSLGSLLIRRQACGRRLAFRFPAVRACPFIDRIFGKGRHGRGGADAPSCGATSRGRRALRRGRATDEAARVMSCAPTARPTRARSSSSSRRPRSSRRTETETQKTARLQARRASPRARRRHRVSAVARHEVDRSGARSRGHRRAAQGGRSLRARRRQGGRSARAAGRRRRRALEFLLSAGAAQGARSPAPATSARRTSTS